MIHLRYDHGEEAVGHHTGGQWARAPGPEHTETQHSEELCRSEELFFEL